MSYDHKTIDKKWQAYWDARKTFRTPDHSQKPKYYVLDMFPYPSGDGLHVGHLEGYTASDIAARYKRMNGFEVLHPMGFDSFGLNAENYAIKVKKHPSEITRVNIARFRTQLKSVGFSYDWDRELATSDVSYYRWTQWLFLKLYERGLAYQAETMVNYCPALKTVLANEEVVDGKSEIGGHPVERLKTKQWILRITEYADRLLEDLDELDWPENIKEMQRNWIGKSHGAGITFEIEGKEPMHIFTTRADTLMGVTFMALAPEHPWVTEIFEKEPADSQLREIISRMLNQSERERESGAKEKLGAPLPLKSVHPLTGKALPVWVANYVLMSYGTGAIMAVPAHDERDLEFAHKYDLPVVQVIDDANTLINSGEYNGLAAEAAQKKITDDLAARKAGDHEIRYRLRDWIFARQRYWGEPIPVLHFEDGSSRPLSAGELPLELPQVTSYEPAGDGKSPLAAVTKWVNVTDPKTGKKAKRETDVMPQWAGSCWYYLRFIDPRNDAAPWDPKLEAYWLPVDLYVGGVEHATLHLLYARFWHKVFYDCGLVQSKEPFKKLVNQGMVLGPDNEKMSKSRGNVINPDEIVEQYGADSLRLYEMFMGPLEMVKPWKTEGILGVHRFLNRVYTIIEEQSNISVADEAPSDEENRALHKCVKKVTEDTDNFKFNTAISEMMTFVNSVYERKRVSRAGLETFVKLLSPYAPHMCEEIWAWLGHGESIAQEAWPTYDKKWIKMDTVTIAVQINGKLRGTIEVSANCPKDDVIEIVKNDPKLGEYMHHPGLIKTIVVPNKIVNIVLKP